MKIEVVVNLDKKVNITGCALKSNMLVRRTLIGVRKRDDPEGPFSSSEIRIEEAGGDGSCAIGIAAESFVAVDESGFCGVPASSESRFLRSGV